MKIKTTLRAGEGYDRPPGGFINNHNEKLLLKVRTSVRAGSTPTPPSGGGGGYINNHSEKLLRSSS